VHLLNEMTDELERMKHIFRNRGLPVPVSSSRNVSPAPKGGKEKVDCGETQDLPPSKKVASSSAVQQNKRQSRDKSPTIKSLSPSPARQRRRSSRDDEIIIKESPEIDVLGETPVEVSLMKSSKRSRSRDKEKKHEHCKAFDPYHNEETDSSIFRVESEESSINQLGQSLETTFAEEKRNKKRSKEKATPSNNSASKSSRDRRKSKTSSSNNKCGCKNDGKSSKRSLSNKTLTKPKSTRGGCFGFFNLFWPKPAYAIDSEDNIATTLNEA